MSDASLPTPPPEPEALPSRRLLVTLTVTLLLFAGSVGVVVWLEHAWNQGRQDWRGATVPAQLFQPKVNLVEQVPFADRPREADYRAPQRARLSGWGWVDRKKGIAHEPVEQAMEQLLREEGRR
jgi:hypothetical protein